MLFLELACIRWFAAYVVFLQFFTNVVLIASFLGMSCGCLAARRLAWFPFIALATVVAVAVYHYWSGLAVDVGHQASPQEVNPDVAQFVVPIEAIAAVFFIFYFDRINVRRTRPGAWPRLRCVTQSRPRLHVKHHNISGRGFHGTCR